MVLYLPYVTDCFFSTHLKIFSVNKGCLFKTMVSITHMNLAHKWTCSPPPPLLLFPPPCLCPCYSPCLVSVPFQLDAKSSSCLVLGYGEWCSGNKSLRLPCQHSAFCQQCAEADASWGWDTNVMPGTHRQHRGSLCEWYNGHELEMLGGEMENFKMKHQRLIISGFFVL